MLSHDEKKLVETLLEDFVVLEKIVGNVVPLTPDPATIRTAITPMLRRWICDGDINKIQKLINSPIKFPTYTHTGDVKACKQGKLVHWIGMIGINQIYISTKLPTDIANPPNIAVPVAYHMNANDFCQQKMMFFNGKFFTRSDIISYAANKMGGTHNPKQSEMKKKYFT